MRRDDLASCAPQSRKASKPTCCFLAGACRLASTIWWSRRCGNLGAEFFFDAVALRPGKPAVFGWCKEKPVFGLPGNPVSTMVTFELFVRPRHRAAERV